MGQVVIHAGMPKTGSTSLQAWLQAEATRLRERHGIHVLREVPDDEGGMAFEDYRSGGMPALFLLAYWALVQQGATSSERRPLADAFGAAMDRAASELGTVVVTAEGFATLLARGDEPFLGALDHLTRRHAVRVTYYVRPQDEALESRWRQWGYLADQAPAAWVREDVRLLDYQHTAATVARLAPAVHFDVRPFRRDLLDDGNVVVDFAQHVLGVETTPDETALRENPGLPLDLAILLRSAPDEVVRPAQAAASHPDDGRPAFDLGVAQLKLGHLARDWSIPESDHAQRSREVLRAFAHDTLEDRNRELIEDVGWPTDHLVPPPAAAPVDELDLDELDRLWQPPCTPTVQAYLHSALHELLRD